MPKIKDLGIKVIPETMQPPGIGPGGGGYGCQNYTQCGCSQNFTCDPAASCFPASCGVSPVAEQCAARTHCQFNTCRFSPGPQACQPTCAVSPAPCLAPTHCGGCSLHPTQCHIPSCLNTPIVCNNCTHTLVDCGCTAVTNPCVGLTNCGVVSPVVNPNPTLFQQAGSLTPEHINALKDQLQKQIQALDEYAKTVAAQSSAQLDAREKQINEELASLKARRKDLEKK
jgi:hypothetical protein